MTATVTSSMLDNSDQIAIDAAIKALGVTGDLVISIPCGGRVYIAKVIIT